MQDRLFTRVYWLLAWFWISQSHGYSRNFFYLELQPAFKAQDSILIPFAGSFTLSLFVGGTWQGLKSTWTKTTSV